ncbi:NDP-sugar synthase [Shewanella fidelis]|uniref:Translation initiation factor eIF2B subunit gamma n=1 Tax=Shewanella fidelis TaxID=173509 RepID=A0AAW8NND1_9GAMM|nr:NDP-sugar synthase [Shewanella fidelis]MDR8524407.1 NDP-sugar synthase [Shewanella fidelis]MDW4811884.1 NDP-sugar synthase [Shewanella fidelis]MDW4817177.1 NDP-sugar synthase [Shewanella fidelis]MDW4821247.1 NDP-sugar synthase [Shewanella fidelis]MDW4822489.1 NDP-sugar synthase [Shewanella fidelis]
MQAVVFANRNGHELMPLNNFYCPALLPVSNKSVIEYTLEDLANAGIKQVKLVISSQVSQLKSLVGTGERWGLSVDYFLCRDQELASEILPRLLLDKTEAILLARADMLRSPSITSFVSFSQQMPSSLVIAKINNQNAGLMMLPAAADYTDALNWPLIDSSTLIDKVNCDSVTQVLHGNCFMLNTLDNYVLANQCMAKAEVTGCIPNGLFHSSAAQQLGFYIGAKAKTGELRTQNAWGVIGDNSWIDASVTMQQSVVIGHNCIVDKGCQLKNCIILDNSYIGQNLDVSDAIICNSLLISAKTGGYIELNDDSLLSKNEPIQVHRKASFSQQLAAALLLFISLLFSPLLLLAAVFHKPKLPLYKEVLTLEQQTISSWRLNLDYPAISRLPQLPLVISGKLNLFGRSPFNSMKTTPTKANHSAANSTGLLQQLQQAKAPLMHYGLYGPVQLQTSKHIPEEERALIEAEFAQLTTRQQLLKLVTHLRPNRGKKAHYSTDLQ